jgi:hypothetical protein
MAVSIMSLYRINLKTKHYFYKILMSNPNDLCLPFIFTEDERDFILMICGDLIMKPLAERFQKVKSSTGGKMSLTLSHQEILHLRNSLIKRAYHLPSTHGGEWAKLLAERCVKALQKFTVF